MMGFFDKLFSSKQQDFILKSPVKGQAVPLSEVSDPTFGEGILGQGVAIKPSADRVCAPCDAVVEMMFESPRFGNRFLKRRALQSAREIRRSCHGRPAFN